MSDGEGWQLIFEISIKDGGNPHLPGGTQGRGDSFEEGGDQQGVPDNFLMHVNTHVLE